MENFCKLIKDKKSSPRLFREMKPVLKNPEITNNNPEKIAYDVYRGVETNKDLRYDLTFLHPEKMGDEFSKTYGHYHKNNMMEVMDVLEGKVLWLLQRYKNDPEIITEVYLIEGKENEKIVFPVGFGVISINNTEKETVLSNWVSPKTISDYKPYENLHGACYYITSEGYIKNPNYKEVPELIHLKPKEVPEIGLTFNKPLIEFTAEQLEFLNNPEKYKEVLTIENCYIKI